jgi:hypothetical protein
MAAIKKTALIYTACFITLGLLSSPIVVAQPPTNAKKAGDQNTKQTATPSPADDLALKQDKIAAKYGELEKVLLRLAEYEALTNPKRAAVLKQAATQSAESLTKAKLVAIAKFLNSEQYSRALTSQKDVQADLKVLLALLQSENETASRKSEQQKIKDYIKELNRLDRMQESLKARTENSEDPKSLSKEQEGVANSAQKVKEEIAEQEGNEGQSPTDENAPSPNDKDPSKEPKPKNAEGDVNKKPNSEKPSGDKPQGEGEQGKPAPGEENSSPEKKSDENQSKQPNSGSEGEQKPNEPKSSQQGKGGKESPSEPQEDAQQAPPKDSEQAQENTKPTVQDRVKAAEKKMRDAQKKLDQAKRDEAVKDQQKAQEELKKAVAELEEILKQLREEEIEQTLADLATRFRKMLEMQLKVHESTLQLTKIPTDKRGREVDLQATRLSGDEQKIVHEAEKALTLLGDEGSSNAFPAAVEQLCADLRQVVERLAQVKIDSLTVGIQEEAIQTLEQLIAALDLEQKEREKKKQQEEQESPAPEQQPGEDPLLDKIAELKLVRSMQQRINSRTARLSKLLTDPDDPIGQANSADLEANLLQLSEWEETVYRVTRDIVVGRKQ